MHHYTGNTAACTVMEAAQKWTPASPQPMGWGELTGWMHHLPGATRASSAPASCAGGGRQKTSNSALADPFCHCALPTERVRVGASGCVGAFLRGGCWRKPLATGTPLGGPLAPPRHICVWCSHRSGWGCLASPSLALGLPCFTVARVGAASFQPWLGLELPPFSHGLVGAALFHHGSCWGCLLSAMARLGPPCFSMAHVGAAFCQPWIGWSCLLSAMAWVGAAFFQPWLVLGMPHLQHYRGFIGCFAALSGIPCLILMRASLARSQHFVYL